MQHIRLPYVKTYYLFVYQKNSCTFAHLLADMGFPKV